MENAEIGLYHPPTKRWKLRKNLSVEYLFSSGFGFIYLNTTQIQRKNSSLLKSNPTVLVEGCARASLCHVTITEQIIQLFFEIGPP